MPTLKKRDIISSLQRKGFVLKEGSKHTQLVYQNRQGRLTASRTALSRGHSDIGSPLVSKMARDVKLDTNRFCELVECSLGQREYHKILQEKNIIEGNLDEEPNAVNIPKPHREKIQKELTSLMNGDFNPDYSKIYGLLEENPVGIETVRELEDMGFDVDY